MIWSGPTPPRSIRPWWRVPSPRRNGRIPRASRDISRRLKSSRRSRHAAAAPARGSRVRRLCFALARGLPRLCPHHEFPGRQPHHLGAVRAVTEYVARLRGCRCRPPISVRRRFGGCGCFGTAAVSPPNARAASSVSPRISSTARNRRAICTSKSCPASSWTALL